MFKRDQNEYAKLNVVKGDMLWSLFQDSCTD